MCNKCNNSSCGGNPCNKGGVDIPSLLEKVSELQEQVDIIEGQTRFLAGHPIIMIDDPDDIALFDLSSGEGFNIWEGWAICNGASHFSPSANKNISTPNLLDRFIVGALGTYAVGDIGGANDVALAVSELPAHNHGVTDPGHSHVITDPGHSHQLQDPGHTHAAAGSSAMHKHELSLVTVVVDGVADHKHTIRESTGVGITDGVIDFTSAPSQAHDGDSDETELAGAHTHSAALHGQGGIGDPETDEASAGVTVDIDGAYTGLTMDDAFTGISIDSASTGISTDNEGGGQAHENRPPYYALIFIKKIY